MKINPLKEYNKPNYPDLEQLSKSKPSSKRGRTALAALLAITSTISMTACREVATSGVVQTAGDEVAVDGNMQIETEIGGAVAIETEGSLSQETCSIDVAGAETTGVEIAGGLVYEDMNVSANYYKINTDEDIPVGKEFILDKSEVRTGGPFEFYLSDNSLLTICGGNVEIYYGISAEELTAMPSFDIRYTKNTRAVETVEGDVVVFDAIQASYCIEKLGQSSLAGDVAIDVTLAGNTYPGE